MCLIPETLKRTTLGARRAGRHVNLEVDVIAKYVERLLARHDRVSELPIRRGLPGRRPGGAAVGPGSRGPGARRRPGVRRAAARRAASVPVARSRDIRFDPIERAIEDIAAGKAVVVVDDEDRENEGDLIFAAAKATPELLAFMIRHTSGVICVPMTAKTLDRLELPPMTPATQDRKQTAFTVSVDAATGVTHGHLGRRPRAHDPGPR